jgi:xyloglucan-specific exo-beta-1,4-glucanase
MRLMKTGLSLLAAMVIGSTASAQVVPGTTAAPDRRAEWSWQPVAIGAGGFIRGMVIHPTLSRAVRYARTDTYGAYRWEAATGRWVDISMLLRFRLR